MTILVDAAARAAAELERTESTEGPFDEVSSLVERRVVGHGGLDPHVATLDQVAEQHADDPDRHLHERGDLGDRAGVAHLEDATDGALGRMPAADGSRTRVASIGRSTLERVRPAVSVYGRTKRGVEPASSDAGESGFAMLGHRATPPRGTRARAWTIRPTRSTSSAIS